MEGENESKYDENSVWGNTLNNKKATSRVYKQE